MRSNFNEYTRKLIIELDIQEALADQRFMTMIPQEVKAAIQAENFRRQQECTNVLPDDVAGSCRNPREQHIHSLFGLILVPEEGSILVESDGAGAVVIHALLALHFAVFAIDKVCFARALI